MSDVLVQYTCGTCAVRGREMRVRARGRDEDVVTWMREVTRAVSGDHAMLSPLCVASTLAECRIQLPGDPRVARVGDPIKH